MSHWSKKRKGSILFVFFVVAFAILVFLSYKIFYRPASCTDGRQNGSESGTDCGGSCKLICKNQAASPIILWQRLFRVSPGLYTAAVYIQNPNLDAGAYSVPYRMRVIDDYGVSIYERNGFVDIYPKYPFPLIETGVLLGERIGKRLVFEFTGEPVWQREQAQITALSITNEAVYNEFSSPRVEALLENNTAKDIYDTKVAVIVYDASGNAMGVSKTIVSKVPAFGSYPAVFSWPEPFPSTVTRKEIIILR